MPTGSGRTLGERPAHVPLLFARGSSLTLGPPCRELSKEPHLATSSRDEVLVQLLLQRWQDPESGLDSAGTSEYEVLLSFPSQKQPNRVDVGEVLLWPGEACGPGELPAQPGHCPLSTVGPAGGILFSSQRSEENLTGEQGDPNVVPPYAAYAPPGTPQVGLGHPLPTAMAQLPLASTPAAPILTHGQLKKSASTGAQPHPEFTCFHTPLRLLLPIT